MKIRKHDTKGRYAAAYATNLDVFKIAHFVADTRNPVEAVAIRVTPGRVEFVSGSTHKHAIECDAADFEAVAGALHAGIRWHIRRNML